MGCPRSKHLGCCIGPDLWTVVGQVFVRDAMWYQGNIEGDIADGKVVLEEFFLE